MRDSAFSIMAPRGTKPSHCNRSCDREHCAPPRVAITHRTGCGIPHQNQHMGTRVEILNTPGESQLYRMKRLINANRPIRYLTCATLFGVALLWGCSPAQPPEQVASAFWAATLSGDRSTVRQLALASSFATADFDAARHNEMFESVSIGEAQIDGSRATIDTHLRGTFYGEPGTVEFDTVAVIHERQWKIDYAATASEMIGAFLGYTVTDLDQEMRDQLKVLGEDVGESIWEDLKNPPDLNQGY